MALDFTHTESVRDMAATALQALYGLSNPAVEEIEAAVTRTFVPVPVFQFPGFQDLNRLFGCFQGLYQVTRQFQAFYSTIEVERLEKQFVIVAGLEASAHYQATWRFKQTGSTFDFEFVAQMAFDADGLLRDLKLYFDTASFLKAAQQHGKRFTDPREGGNRPAFDPRSARNAAKAQSNVYDTFLRLPTGEATWDGFYALFSDDVEVVFKSNTDVLPYAGFYEGKEGLKAWFSDLFSIWSLNAFNFTRVIGEGNTVDFAMHELHYYNNPDGTKRYLDVYIVQSWRIDEAGKICLFKSYNDSAWLDETFNVTDTYKAHYGYPNRYACAIEGGNIPERIAEPAQDRVS